MRKLLLISFLLLACGGADETAPQAQVDSTGVIEPSFSIGEEMGDSTVVFGALETVIYDSRGNIAALDMGMANVRIFSPEGEYLRTIGRRGNGPGEFQRPLGMVLLGTGSIGVMDPWGEGFTEITSNYEQAGVLMEIHSNVHLGMCGVDSTDIIGIRAGERTSDEPSVPFVIGRYSLSTEPSVIYWRKEFPALTMEDLAEAMREYAAIAFTADPASGDVYVCPYVENRYEITRCSDAGEVLNTIAMEIPAVDKTEEEVAVEAEYLRARITALNGSDMGIDITPYPERRSVSSMGVDGHGCLWVRRGTEEEALLDRWTPEGELLGTYRVPDSNLYWRFSFCRQGILAFNENPDEYQQIFVMEYPPMNRSVTLN
ncbi:MAG: hypothetical protein GF388_01930 [Candidatus Aegiribacteria sp.]|nr:hypothetical protein [Candidatus Aegiribacteria sp.]